MSDEQARVVENGCKKKQRTISQTMRHLDRTPMKSPIAFHGVRSIMSSRSAKPFFLPSENSAFDSYGSQIAKTEDAFAGYNFKIIFKINYFPLPQNPQGKHNQPGPSQRHPCFRHRAHHITTLIFDPIPLPLRPPAIILISMLSYALCCIGPGYQIHFPRHAHSPHYLSRVLHPCPAEAIIRNVFTLYCSIRAGLLFKGHCRRAPLSRWQRLAPHVLSPSIRGVAMVSLPPARERTS